MLSKKTSALIVVLILFGFMGAPQGAETNGLFPQVYKEIKIDNFNITLGGDNRLRYEYKQNFDLNDNINDNDGLWYNRLRFNLNANINDKVLFFFEGLDAHEWTSDATPNFQEDNFDLHQGYIKLIQPYNLPLNLTIGRQELSYGAKRLIAAPTWSNTIRSFDAVKLAFTLHDFDIDLFVGNRVIYEDDHFNDGYWGENIFGFYLIWKGITDNVFDLYWLDLNDQRNVDDGLERHTIGTRGEGKIQSSGLRYGYEFAYQFGEKDNSNTQAYAYHVDLSYPLHHMPWNPTIKIEYNFASGDDNPKDGKDKTFNPLFQTVHEPYGLMDFFRWQNIKEVAVSLNFIPIKDRLSGSIQYHNFWLADTHDSWYNSSGKVMRGGRPGGIWGKNQMGKWVWMPLKTSDDMGEEFDIFLKYKPLNFFELEGGYAHFFCGNAIKETGSHNDADWFYLQMVVTF